MPTLQRPGVDIHYDVVGAGPAVLITHGYSATSHMWRETARALAADHRVITWDLRGHGRSGSPADPALYSRDLAAADMAALLDAVGTEDAVLMGHSLGGYLSLAFHVEHAARVRGMVLVGTGPGYRNADARAGWNRQAEGRAKFFERRGLDGLDTPAAHGGEHRSAVGLALAARGILAQHDSAVMDELARITVPVLVMVGDADTPFLGAGEYMARRLADAELTVIAGAGHMTNLDQPQAFQQALSSFLGSRLGKPASAE